MYLVMMLSSFFVLVGVGAAPTSTTAAVSRATDAPLPSHYIRASRYIRRRRMDVKAGPHHRDSSSSVSTNDDDLFSEPPDPQPQPSIFSLSRYVDPDSITYDTIEGFFYAAIFTVIFLALYKCCCSCLDRCGLCPENEYMRKRRHRKRGGAAGHEYAAVSTDLYRGDHTRGGYRNEYSDCDGSSSGEESDVSAEYGEVGNDDRFGDRHIGDAAKRYFDREERIDRQRQQKQNQSRAGGGGGGGSAKRNGAARINGGDKHSRRGGLHRAISGGTGVIDGEEPAPLDLEMIERKVVESMEDGPEFAKPKPSKKEG